MSTEPGSGVRRETKVSLRSIGMTAIHLSHAEIVGFYQRYANGVLWPALHDMLPVEHDRDDWRRYRAVNVKFAREVVRQLRHGDLVWIHDYHLMLVPRLVREQCPWARIGFFLHTPFPRAESFARIPQAEVLIDGLLAADTIGVHTDEYVQNFLDVLNAIPPSRTRGRPIEDARRRGRVVACPMSVDTAALGAIATRSDVTDEAARLRAAGRIFAGVDRLDYTKGIPERLRAFERLLERQARLRGSVKLIQIAVPSREGVTGYRQIRRDVEAAVTRINSRWGRSDWQPVHYYYGSIELAALVALYRATDVMLVTPLRDGMNLVAKEFVAARVDNDGVLLLSDRAGAAAELCAALLVNPTDDAALADAYETALDMPAAERRVRMRHLRSIVTRNDVYQWAESSLAMLACERDDRVHESRA